MDLREDMIIGTVDDRELHVDVFAPDARESLATAIIHLHGGGWRLGSRKWLRPRSEALAERGFTVIAAEYRLVDESPWPAQLHDVKAAIRWTRAHADDLNVDAGHIAVMGHSAGAHLGLIAAGTAGRPDLEGAGPEIGTDSSLAAAVAFYPPIWFSAADQPPGGMADKRARPADGTAPSWMLLGDGASAAAIAAVMPPTYFSDRFPPTCIFHGTNDSSVPVASSLHLRESLVEYGIETELHLFSRQDHEFDASGPYLELAADETALFLRKTVAEPDKLAEQFARLPDSVAGD